MPSNHLILCHLLLLLSSVLSIRIFSNESVLCIRWPNYWSFSFSINPSNEHSGLIFFRIDWFDLLAVHRTLKSLLQHHSSKHQFFGAQTSLWSNCLGKISWSLLKLTSIESVMPSNNLILCRPLLLPSIFPSIRVFSNELVLHQAAKVLEFQLQHQSFQ